MNGLLNLKNTANDLNAFAEKIDNNLREKNMYYDDLISGNILTLKDYPIKKKWLYRLYEIHWQIGRAK